MAVVAVAMFVIGPFFSSMGFRSYFATSASWKYGSTALLYGQQYTLPGVFGQNRWGADVNSSLWTLRYEVLFYVLVPVLVVIGARRAQPLLALVLAAALAFVATAPAGTGLPIPGQMDLVTLSLLLAFFVCGSLLRLSAEALRFRGVLATVAGAGAIAGILWSPLLFVVPPTLAYVSLYIGLGTRPVDLGRLRSIDLSYGVYIYGFLVEQSVIALLGGSASVAAILAISCPVTVVVAWWSWRLVEAPSLGLKGRFLARREAGASTTGAPGIAA